MSEKPHRIIQLQRTRAGVCAVCGYGMLKHTGQNATCPDGKDSYTWAHTRTETEQLIANLEAVLAAAKGN